MDLSHEEIKSLVAPYVLGAVSTEEMEIVREHILTCEECTAEADDYSDVVASLALGVEGGDVPEGFIDEVMSAARSDEERPRGVVTPAPVAARPTTRPSTGAPKPGPSEADTRPRVVTPRRFSGVSLLAAAAMLIVISVLSVWLISTRGALNDTRDQLAAQQGQLEQLVASQGGRALEGEGQSRGVIIPTDDGGVFLASGLKGAPTNRTYQLWLIEGDRPIGAGTFDTTDGVGGVTVDRPVRDVDDLAVTVEPQGGSRQPTTTPILTT
jgi:hypothetical protein